MGAEEAETADDVTKALAVSLRARAAVQQQLAWNELDETKSAVATPTWKGYLRRDFYMNRVSPSSLIHYSTGWPNPFNGPAAFQD